MTTNHIDQLTQWWENAEKGTPREGDTYIARFPSGDGYETGVADSDGLPPGMLRDTRILARAPKPKPAWHNAVAVIAGLGGERQVFTPTVSGMWESEDSMLTPDEMANPVPLIEAKVTDEMVERARDYMSTNTGQTHTHKAIRGVLTAALGLETE